GGNTGSIGDLVWEDTNGNGVQDPGEPGLGNVTVNLLDGNGQPFRTRTTDDLGRYSFVGLVPGEYIVEFVAPDGYAFSPQEQGGDDDLDSDADPATGQTALVTLSSAENNLSIDAGLRGTGEIRGTKWSDLNGDGEPDAGEPGLPNVTIYLDLDYNGRLDDNEPSTETNGNGEYSFTGLEAGEYTVAEVVPEGYVQTFPTFDEPTAIRLLSRSVDGMHSGNAESYTGTTGALSAYGDDVVFWSFASDLVDGDANASRDIFVYDRQENSVDRVSLDYNGDEANAASWAPSISADGHVVALKSQASDIVPEDTGDHNNIFVRNLSTEVNTLASVAMGAEPDRSSYDPSISGDGGRVAFMSDATNLVSGDTNGGADVFVYDRQGAIERVSVSSTGEQANGESGSP
ncbi:hypothetical protein LCGC14_2831390, partial [marine sediment metagenome]